MRLQLMLVPAMHVPNDSFVYLPNENRYFYIDDIVTSGDTTTLIHEVELDENVGIKEVELKFKNLEELYVLMQYNCNTKDQLQSINNSVESYSRDEDL